MSRDERRGRRPGSGVQTAGMVCLYVAATVAPLAAALLPPVPPPRGLWVEFSVGLGFVGLAMLALQLLLTARVRRLAAPVGLDAMLQFHRQVGLLAVGLILAHPVILFVRDPQYLEFLDPRVSFVRAAALAMLTVCLVLVAGLTLSRRSLGLSYEWWRASHAVLGLLVVGLGLVHVLRVGYYVSTPSKQALWLVPTGAALGLLLWIRLVKPLRLRARPYRVSEVRPERGRTWTLALDPEGHGGLRFRPGEFAWLILDASPFSPRQHPFSFSSSAERRERLEMTIKELGDFTTTIGQVRLGTRAYLDGPFGAFTLDLGATVGAAFVAGGVGITPIMSMLRTLADRGDRRPLHLVYGSPSWDDVIFREDLDALAGRLDLTVIHVLEQPPAGWDGETGLITPAVLDRGLPAAGRAGLDYFVCGPPAMMDAVEGYLLETGIPLRNVQSERFELA